MKVFNVIVLITAVVAMITCICARNVSGALGWGVASMKLAEEVAGDWFAEYDRHP